AEKKLAEQVSRPEVASTTPSSSKAKAKPKRTASTQPARTTPPTNNGAAYEYEPDPVDAAPVGYQPIDYAWFANVQLGTNDSECVFGDCAASGWVVNTSAGSVEASCIFGECYTSGWDVDYPDGTRGTVSCNFGECWTNGWALQAPDGSVAGTTCLF